MKLSAHGALSAEQLRMMERAGHITARALRAVRDAITTGITPRELDAIAYRIITEAGATPNFLGYYDYPATLCISVNETVVHGIPNDEPLKEGDVASVDGGCYVVDDRGRQWHSDSAFTVVVGEASESDRGLVNTTEAALWAAIAAVAGEPRVGSVGRAVEETLAAHRAATGQRLTAVSEFVGHGIGQQMHLSPDVPNVNIGKGAKLEPGSAIAIEPIIAAGNPSNITLDDGWTVKTRDGSHAAHWEHTIAVVNGGVRVLTARDGGVAGLAPYGITPAGL